MVKFEKKIDGLFFDDPNYRLNPKQITVRGTSDYKGKSLSLADEEKGIMIMIPLEPVMYELRQLLKDRG